MVKKNTSGCKLKSARKQRTQTARSRGLNKKKSSASTNVSRDIPHGKKAGFYRDASKIALLNLYNKKPDVAKRRIQPQEPVRIEPDRRWFGNTRVITQSKLQEFRHALAETQNNPYRVILKKTKLPVTLFASEEKHNHLPRHNILALEPYKKVFSQQQSRKRPTIAADTLDTLAQEASNKLNGYDPQEDLSLERTEPDAREAARQEVFKKGTSRRIWQELYKVIDSSDILVYVIDARDPMGTRCITLEKQLKKNKPNKHFIFLLNKCDLVPTWSTTRWLSILASECPTVAFHSSLTNPFGKQALVNLLRQYAGLMKERKHVSVGFIGYPNVGKSSVINTLKSQNVCRAAPVPGETKIWQYVALTHRLYLIDCPGVVMPCLDGTDNDTVNVLKGVIRAERLSAPEEHIDEVLQRVDANVLIKKYSLDKDTQWNNAEEFLEILARRLGKLLKGGQPNTAITARIVLYDWQRGKIPFFVPPPLAASRSTEE